MLDTFFATLSPMLVMFTLMVVGFVAKKANVVPENTATVLSKLENNFFVPALMINTFMKYCTVDSLKENYSLLLYSILGLGVAFILCHPLASLFEKKDLYRRNVYKYIFIVGNFGFLGNAVILDLFGDATLYYYLLFTLPIQTLVNTWGLAIMIPKSENNASVFSRLKTPVFASIIIGAALGLTGLGREGVMPAFLSGAIGNCASCMGPVAMILAGFVIGGYDVKKMITSKRIYLITFLRLIVLPFLMLSILYLCGADERVLTFALFVFATPSGLNAVIFPAAYGGDTYTGASTAMVSSTLCILTIPLLYALLTVLV